MISIIKYLAVFLIAIALTATALFNWLGIKFNHSQRPNTISYQHVLQYSHIVVADSANSCNSEQDLTVAEIIGTMLVAQQNHVNDIELSCFSENCSISFSYCLPWQSSECSQRFLRFDLDEHNQVKTDSFQCFDLP